MSSLSPLRGPSPLGTDKGLTRCTIWRHRPPWGQMNGSLLVVFCTKRETYFLGLGDSGRGKLQCVPFITLKRVPGSEHTSFLGKSERKTPRSSWICVFLWNPETPRSRKGVFSGFKPPTASVDGSGSAPRHPDGSGSAPRHPGDTRTPRLLVVNTV